MGNLVSFASPSVGRGNAENDIDSIHVTCFPFDDMPDDIQFLVLSFFDLKTLFRLRRVSKKWNSLCLMILPTLDTDFVSHFKLEALRKAFEFYLRTVGSIRFISLLYKLSDEDFDMLMEKAHTINTLYMNAKEHYCRFCHINNGMHCIIKSNEPEPGCDKDQFLRLIPRCKNLAHLYCNDLVLPDLDALSGIVANAFPNLKTLDLRNVTIKTFDWQSNGYREPDTEITRSIANKTEALIKDHLTSLRSLTMKPALGYLSEEQICSLVHRNPNIHTLDVTFSVVFSEHHAETIAEALGKNLRVLRIAARCSSLSNLFLRIASQCPNLEELYIKSNNSSGFNNNLLAKLKQLCPKLSNVTVV